MSNYIVDGSDLTSVANAIRAKSGGISQLAFPAGFVSEIGNIPTGGGIADYETGELTLASEVHAVANASTVFPNLQLSFHPDVFLLFIPHSEFVANVTKLRAGAAFKAVAAIRKTLVPAWNLSRNVSTDASTNDYIWINLNSVAANTSAEGGFALNAFNVVDNTYSQYWKLNSDGTFAFGTYSSSSCKFYSCTYRYFAMRIPLD